MLGFDVLDYTWLIPTFPFLAFLAILLFGKQDYPTFKGGERGGAIAALGVGLAAILSIMTAWQVLVKDVLHDEHYIQKERVWFEGNTFAFDVGTYVDALAAMMLFVVGTISFLVIIFSMGYMAGEGDRRVRYFAEISLFVSVMLGLVVSNSLLLLFIFWELVGVCSYLLIGFWYEKPSAASAAKKAFIVTRIGDIFFLLGLIILYNTFGTLRFDELFHDHDALASHATELKWATLCIFGGAVGKSAQFPLHFWLPDAMEGPTTVSALIHAATMVKAGVYLIARFFPLMVHSPDTLIYIAVTGAVTAFIAAAMAMVMNDIKRVLAYSTISQLGYMFLALGAGGWAFWNSGGGELSEAHGYTAGMFHLMNHAFFKALLFLGAGSVIHAVHTQDMREMGGLRKAMPITSLTMGLAVLSISGIPFFSGFWSKDEILEAVHHNGEYSAIFSFLWVMALLTAGMTAFYMTRMWMMTFSGPLEKTNTELVRAKGYDDSGDWVLNKENIESHAHESPKIMTVPLIILGFMAVFSGFFLFIGNGFGSAVYYGHHESVDAFVLIEHILTSSLTHLSIAVALTGTGLATAMYYQADYPGAPPSSKPEFITKNAVTNWLHNFLSQRLYIIALTDWIGTKTWDTISQLCDLFDRTIIDGAVNGTASFTFNFGATLRKVHTGFTAHYASLSIGGLGVLVLLLRVIFPAVGWT